MRRLICTLILVLLIVSPSLGQQSLVGTYKLVSHVSEVDGKPFQPLKAPHGYLVLTPTRFLYFITAENRKFDTSTDEKAALFDSLVGYGGVYRVEREVVFDLRGVVGRKHGRNDCRGSVPTFGKLSHEDIRPSTLDQRSI